jgi:putative oxidoreductase
MGNSSPNAFRLLGSVRVGRMEFTIQFRCCSGKIRYSRKGEKPMHSKRRDAGLLLLRVGTGLALASHGYPKLFGGAGKQLPPLVARALGKNFPEAFQRGGIAAFHQGLDQMGVPAPQVAAYLSAATEFGGGIALALGFGIRLVTPLIIGNMGVVIKKAHWTTGFSGPGGYELASLFAVIASALWLTGSGRYSMDHLIQGSNKVVAR